MIRPFHLSLLGSQINLFRGCYAASSAINPPRPRSTGRRSQQSQRRGLSGNREAGPKKKVRESRPDSSPIMSASRSRGSINTPLSGCRSDSGTGSIWTRHVDGSGSSTRRPGRSASGTRTSPSTITGRTPGSSNSKPIGRRTTCSCPGDSSSRSHRSGRSSSAWSAHSGIISSGWGRSSPSSSKESRHSR